MTGRREAISANSPPTKNALPSSNSTVSTTSVIDGLRRGGDADLLDPVAVHLDDRELPTVLDDRLPRARDVGAPWGHQPGRGLVRPFGQREAGLFGELVLPEQAVHQV